jgi:hypothetical protein
MRFKLTIVVVIVDRGLEINYRGQLAPFGATSAIKMGEGKLYSQIHKNDNSIGKQIC